MKEELEILKENNYEMQEEMARTWEKYDKLQEKEERKDKVINQLLSRIANLEREVERLIELCDKYEEEHSTVFEEWKKLVKVSDKE